ncbi:PIG-L family deacetylase [Nocardia sp. CA-128927]|uniref:PIG-L family deacetylase n=1 Tax=Nocardia sp. CA-128927 TaxID=3239975 RepID=UPI003D97264F
MQRTCVFFHAHPDDEALLTAGTMARLVAEGHRVVVVFATDGEQGLAAGVARGQALGALRTAEARVAADVLGCASVEFLGYADSGWSDPVAHETFPFSAADPEEAALRLAAILRREQADLLTTYDPAGGYGHPDHVQAHRVGYRAAALAGTPIVLEATFDRERLVQAAKLLGIPFAGPLRAVRWPGLPRLAPGQFDNAFVARAVLTHRVDVRRWCAAKRAAVAAHASQATGGKAPRTLAGLLRLPGPVFRWGLGTEYYVQRGLPQGTAYTHPLDGFVDADNG